MKEIKILESLLEKLNTNLEEVEYYNYEKHTNIAKFVKTFKEENPTLLHKYITEEDLLPEEINLNDIIIIIDNQIKQLTEAIKKDTSVEYEKVVKQL